VAYEWDADKAAANFQRHGVRFSADAVGVFDDDYAITITDDESDPKEQRFVTLGMGGKGRILVVVYVYRTDSRNQTVIRIISARSAEPHEREEYERQLD
jgi:uncharacterized DUF497 family protein